MATGDISRYDEGLPERFRPVMERVFQAHASVFVVINAFLIAIWAAAGMGSFWPIWPILGWGLAVGLHAMATYSFRR
jgi:hypothetical protein